MTSRICFASPASALIISNQPRHCYLAQAFGCNPRSPNLSASDLPSSRSPCNGRALLDSVGKTRLLWLLCLLHDRGGRQPSEPHLCDLLAILPTGSSPPGKAWQNTVAPVFSPESTTHLHTYIPVHTHTFPYPSTMPPRKKQQSQARLTFEPVGASSSSPISAYSPARVRYSRTANSSPAVRSSSTAASSSLAKNARRASGKKMKQGRLDDSIGTRFLALLYLSPLVFPLERECATDAMSPNFSSANTTDSTTSQLHAKAIWPTKSRYGR